MYIPSYNAESRPEVLLDFIEAHPFGAMVTGGPGGLFATHLPWVVERGEGSVARLLGHVARANPHHRQDQGGEALVIFTGPDAYITPAWYAAKQEHGKVVPTWNYIAVHAYGSVVFRDDAAFLRPHLEALTNLHEQGREHPWRIDDAPADYIDKLQAAIVGVEIEVTRLEGKWKMSQNRSGADIDGVVEGLSKSPDPRDRAVGEVVQQRRPR